MKDPEILASVEAAIDQTLSHSEVRRAFADGKPKTLTYINAILLDGRSLPHPEPLMMSRPVGSADEFDQALDQCVRIQTESVRSAIHEELLIQRALARAALVFGAVISSSDRESPTQVARMHGAIELIGFAAGVLGHAASDDALGLPPEVRARFREYLDLHPEPSAGEFNTQRKERDGH